MRIIICIFVARINKKKALGKFDKYKIDLKGMQADHADMNLYWIIFSSLILIALKCRRVKSMLFWL